MTEPFRITTFTSDPKFILVYAPGDGPVRLPVLTSPFTKAEVQQAFAGVQEVARIQEDVVGRQLRPIVAQQRKDAQSERGQQTRLMQTLAAVIDQGHPSPTRQERSELVLRKQAVDDELRALKFQIGEARARAFERGDYLPSETYRSLERRHQEAQAESQVLQARLTQLKAEEKRANEKVREEREHVFIDVAREVLDKETYLKIWAEVDARMGPDPKI